MMNVNSLSNSSTGCTSCITLNEQGNYRSAHPAEYAAGELDKLLSTEKITADLDNYRKLSRERAEIEPVTELYRTYQQVEQDLATAREMSSDPQFRDFAEAEIEADRRKLTNIETEILRQLLPKDPNDERNIFLEIRAGTEEMSPPCLRAICFACTVAMRSGKDGRWKSFHRILPR